MKCRFLILILIIIMAFTGCSNSYENNDTVKIGYVGSYMELPLFMAYENGYFDKEGLNVKLVKVDEEDTENKIKDGSIDALTCDYRFLKWNEDNISIKTSIGLTSGPIEIIAFQNGRFKEINDIENKRIGIAYGGNGTMTAAINVLNRNNINSKSIQWIYLNGRNPVEAIENKEIDGAVVWNINQEYDDSKIRTVYKTNLADNNSLCTNHSSHSNDYFYINFAGIRAETVDKCPEKSAGILRAWSEGASSVESDKTGALNTAVEKGYIKEIKEDEKAETDYFMWMPSVKSAKKNLQDYISVQKSEGIINSNTDEEYFFNNIFADILPFWD